MKRKNGFTLIELLVVIVLVAIISLIAIPTVNTIIRDARFGAFGRTVENMYEAVDWYLLDVYDGKFASNKVFTLDSNGIVENCNPSDVDKTTGRCMKLKYDGAVDGEGQIIVRPDGKYSIHYSTGLYCATKGFDDKKIRVTSDACPN